MKTLQNGKQLTQIAYFWKIFNFFNLQTINKMKTNASKLQLTEALNFVNKSFDDNIKFKTLEQKTSKVISFTLTVKDSKLHGSKRKQNGNRIAAACWHVHGYFFEYLFLNYPGVYIDSLGQRMNNNADNWRDRNIGSIIQPFYFSEACEC